MEQSFYLAASRREKVNEEEEENIRLKEGGGKKSLRNQRKYVQKHQRSQGVEDTSR